MKKIILSILYYAAAIILILHIHRWSPTTMAGPGFDLLVYFLTPIISIALFAVSLYKKKYHGPWSNLALLIDGLGVMATLVLVYHEWDTSQ